MNVRITDAHSLKVTTDNKGIVWYLDGDDIPKVSEQDCEGFLKSNIVLGAECIRIVGSAANAALLHTLYTDKINDKLPKLLALQVCSPMCCETREERSEPELVLLNMRSFNYSASVGGWHDFDVKDYPAYLLAAHFSKQDEATDFTRKVLTHHPAWPSLSFINKIDVDMTSRLLSKLIDPRWYVDLHADPNQSSRMEQFLNLNPKGQAAASKKQVEWNESLCRLVLDCWKTIGEKDIVTYNSRDFLWRAWGDKGGGLKGDLAASKLFISFLRLTWIQALYKGARPDRLFVPEYFFHHEDEWQAYKEHITNHKTEA